MENLKRKIGGYGIYQNQKLCGLLRHQKSHSQVQQEE